MHIKVCFEPLWFGTDWSMFVDDRVEKKLYSAIFPNSRANNSGCYDLI